MKKLFAVLVLVSCTVFAGCVTSYHIHTFSNEVETLPVVAVVTTNSEGKKVTVYKPTGLFKGSGYEEVMQKAEKAGYTKVLSVEYGTQQFLWLFSVKWVEIRCVKEGGGEPEA